MTGPQAAAQEQPVVTPSRSESHWAAARARVAAARDDRQCECTAAQAEDQRHGARLVQRMFSIFGHGNSPRAGLD